MYELPDYDDLARVTETCKHPNQIPFLGLRSSLPCFTAVVLVCLRAASLVPLLAIFSRSQLPSLSMRRRARAFIKMQCRRVKKMQDNGKVKESVYFLGWNSVFFFLLEKNWNNEPVHLDVMMLLQCGLNVSGLFRTSRLTCKQEYSCSFRACERPVSNIVSKILSENAVDVNTVPDWST